MSFLSRFCVGMRCLLLGFVIVAVGLAGIIGYDRLFPSRSSQVPPRPISDFIQVTTPLPDTLISSPLVIKGQARGNWYFEASFPIELIDANGRMLGSTIAQAQGDWMTTEFVPFIANLSFSLPSTTTGSLVFEKDNPSGLPENAAERRVPVKFAVEKTHVQLYYYRPTQDADKTGNLLCSRQGLVAVDR